MNSYFLYFLCVFMPLITFASPSPEIEVVKIEKGVYVYQSFAEYKDQQVSANGLILESADEAVLIDTPWDKRQTIQLLNPQSSAGPLFSTADRILTQSIGFLLYKLSDGNKADRLWEKRPIAYEFSVKVECPTPPPDSFGNLIQDIQCWRRDK